MLDLRAAKVLLLAALAMVLLATTNFSSAVFTDSSSSSATVKAASDWTPPTVNLLGASSYLRGASVSLTASASDGESRIANVTIEHAPKGVDSWTLLCASGSANASCTWNTTLLRDGQYDVRASATDAAGYSASTTARVTVDNTAPSVTMKDPGSPLTGTKAFEATGVTDATSGVARVDIEYALGTGPWQNLCTVLAPTPAWSCSYDTAKLSTGTYSFRASATDVAGNRTTSGVVSGRQVDNTAPTVSLKDPGAVLAGTVTLEAVPASPAGTGSVQFQYVAAGGTDWRNIGKAVIGTPYSVAWDTRGVPDGAYDLRVVMLDAAGRPAEAVRAGHRVANTSQLLLPLDIYTVNKTGGVNGDIENGDALVLTYRGKIDPARVLQGWTGTSAANVTLEFVDVKERETLTFSADRRVNLGSIWFDGGQHLKKDKSMSVGGTMTAATVTTDGETVTIVTIQLVDVPGNNSANEKPTKGGKGTMTWTACTSGEDLLGGACTGSLVEPGDPDVDF